MHGSRQIRIDSAEQPDYIPSPQLDPTGYSANRQQRRVGRRMPFFAYVLIFVVVSVFVVGLFLVMRSFVEYRYRYDLTFQRIVDIGTNMLFAFLFVSACAIAVSLAVGLFNWAVKVGILDMPGGMIAHILDILLDWRRGGSKSIVEWSTARHYDVQTVLAEKSIYRNVTAYSPSLHYHLNNKNDITGDSSLGGDILMEIPSFDDLIHTSQLGSESGLMLGIAGSEAM